MISYDDFPQLMINLFADDKMHRLISIRSVSVIYAALNLMTIEHRADELLNIVRRTSNFTRRPIVEFH